MDFEELGGRHFGERHSPGVEVAQIDLLQILIEPAAWIEMTAALQRLGYAPEKGFRDALARWIGTENFEERDVPGKIDPLVLDHLRKQVGAVHA